MQTLTFAVIKPFNLFLDLFKVFLINTFRCFIVGKLQNHIMYYFNTKRKDLFCQRNLKKNTKYIH